MAVEAANFELFAVEIKTILTEFALPEAEAGGFFIRAVIIDDLQCIKLWVFGGPERHAGNAPFEIEHLCLKRAGPGSDQLFAVI